MRTKQLRVLMLCLALGASGMALNACGDDDEAPSDAGADGAADGSADGEDGSSDGAGDGDGDGTGDGSGPADGDADGDDDLDGGADGDGSEDGGDGSSDGDAGGDGSIDEPATFTRVYEIITDNCSPCHISSEPRRGGLDMSTKAMAYAELVDMEAEGQACDDMGRTRVVPDDGENSLLIQKLRGVGHCGERMPFDGPYLPDAVIDEIETWIEAGAENN